MVGREFDPSLIPTDPAHWNCAYCGYFSTNTVPEDAGAVDMNSDMLLHTTSFVINFGQHTNRERQRHRVLACLILCHQRNQMKIKMTTS